MGHHGSVNRGVILFLIPIAVASYLARTLLVALLRTKHLERRPRSRPHGRGRRWSSCWWWSPSQAHSWAWPPLLR